MADIDIQHLVQITNVGLWTADFVDIKAAIIDWYKSIYGDDIDLSTGSADGVFVNDLALILNNILEAVSFVNRSLNVNEASGIYLDRLCRLSNVTRNQATHSTATIKVTNLDSTDYRISVNEELKFLDKASTVWTFTNNTSSTFVIPANGNAILNVVCDEVGQIKAPSGWIDRTLELTQLVVEQTKDAIVGQNIESDSSLRSRRLQSLGAYGVTVVESLVASLLEIAGIQDVLVYNNNTSAAQVTADGTTVDAHNVYVIVRYVDGIDLASLDDTIGNMIYNKLTPGIATTKCNVVGTSNYAYGRTYEFIPEQLGTSIKLFHQDVYWKESRALNPEISVTLNIERYFTQDEIDTIGVVLIEYLNELPISSNLSAQKLMVEVLDADPRFRGVITYTVGDIKIAGATTYENPDGHFKYTTVDYTKVDPSQLGNTVTFKLH